MGYQITWRSKDLPEIKSEFKSFWKDDDRLQETVDSVKRDLLISCMNYNKESENVVNNLIFKINCYKNALEQVWKLNLQERLKEEEIWFCGWEYSRDEVTDYIDVVIENIITYTLCSKPSDPINDSEYFFEKMEKIKEELDSMEDAVNDKWNHKFVDEYREYQIKYDEEESTESDDSTTNY